MPIHLGNHSNLFWKNLKQLSKQLWNYWTTSDGMTEINGNVLAKLHKTVTLHNIVRF